jgi:hypothetical protein
MCPNLQHSGNTLLNRFIKVNYRIRAHYGYITTMLGPRRETRYDSTAQPRQKEAVEDVAIMGQPLHGSHLNHQCKVQKPV